MLSISHQTVTSSVVKCGISSEVVCDHCTKAALRQEVSEKIILF